MESGRIEIPPPSKWTEEPFPAETPKSRGQGTPRLSLREFRAMRGRSNECGVSPRIAREIAALLDWGETRATVRMLTAPVFPGHGLQGCQKIHHGGGLAGTRTTGDHGEAVTGGQSAGQFLVIHRLCGLEQFAERCG